MPSTATTRNKFEKQAAGENTNTWGTKVNNVWDMLDACLSGVLDIVTSGGTTTLTDADYTADQAKHRAINCTGTGGQIAIPNVEKVYLIRNGSSGDLTITTGSGTTAIIPPGNIEEVVSTGSNEVYSQSGGGFRSLGKMGYATGAGGAVTQATSKSTGVTLHKLSGQITLNAASLAAGTVVNFLMTNNQIEDGDQLIISHRSGGTRAAYTISATCSSGSADIYIRNNTAGALAEELVLRFAVFKTVAA